MKNKRRGSITIAVVLFCLVISLVAFWQTKGPQVLDAIKDVILVRSGQVLNGRLAAEHLDFSLLGTTTAHKLVVYDKQENVIVSCDRVTIDFGIADLLRGNFAVERIKHVTLEGARIDLSQDATGKWNIEGLFKPISDDSQHFLGEVKVRGGSVSVSGQKGLTRLEQVEGALDFTSYPDVRALLAGRLGESNITAEGYWNASGAMKMNLQADRLESRQMMMVIPSVDKFAFQSGYLYDLKAVLHRDKGPVKIEADAFLSGLDAEIAGVKITDMQGRIRFADNILEIQDADLLYGGQKLAANGTIDFTASKPRFDFTVKAESLDLKALLPKSPVVGTISFQVHGKGSPEELEVSGNFSIPAGAVSSTSFTDATGTFDFAKNILTFKTVNLESLGGRLSLSGAWDLKNALFKVDITGKNLAAEALSGGEILGSMDLQVRATGKDAAGAEVQGKFSMPTATISGTIFEKIAGNMRKTGQSLEFTDLNFSTSGQKMTAGGKILFGGTEPELDLHLRSDGIEIAAIKPGVPISGQLAFQAVIAGTLKKHAIAGSVQFPDGKFGSLAVVDTEGDFHFAEDVLTLKDFQLGLLDGSMSMQRLTVDGKILLSGNDPGLDLRVSSHAIDLAAVKLEVTLAGKLAFQSVVSGTAKDPAIIGSFQIPSGQIDGVPFADGTGDFRFAGDVWDLRSIRLNVFGGSVTTEGTISNTGTYFQQVSGQNLEAALLTDGDVRGKTSFTAAVRGAGGWKNSSAEGSIAIKSGTIKNTDFSSLNLEFRKQGERIEIPSMDIKFLRGLVKGTGFMEGDYLVVKLSPAKNRRSRFLGISTFILFGSNPLTAIIGQALSEQFPLGVMRIRINGLKNQ